MLICKIERDNFPNNVLKEPLNRKLKEKWLKLELELLKLRKLL